MLARATGLFSIYRGTTTNSSGDPVDDNVTTTATDVPMALHNNTVIEGDPDTATPRVITAIRGRATRGTDLRAQDRIKDQATGLFYVVDTVSAPLSSTRNSDLGFSCHRVN
jgi:hypothetical protein